MHFELISTITGAETIAEGHGIRELARLRRCYGTGNWRKKKGTATVRFRSGEDYLYPAPLFAAIAVPDAIAERLAA